MRIAAPKNALPPRPPPKPAATGRWVTAPGAGYGSDGPQQTVLQLQQRLRQLGYDVPTDGRFGPLTATAVRAFQGRHKLEPSGAVDNATLELLQTPPGHPLARLRARKEKAAGATRKPPAATQKRISRPPGSADEAPQEPAGKPTQGAKSGGDEGVQITIRHPESADVQSGEKLQETTFEFGFGGDRSRSIKDYRDREPAYDLPIWTRSGVRAYRSTAIPDSRDVRVEAVSLALAEAVKARKAAKDGFAFARARAREELLRAELQEAFREALHPRGRGGRWIEVLNRLKGAKTNKPIDIDGVPALKLSNGRYAATVGSELVHDSDPEKVAHAIASHLHQKEALRASGEEALRGLSHTAAQHFTRDWSLRGDEAGLPERQEMYQQVYSEDPRGFVRDVFSTKMKPEVRREAEQALADAKARARREFEENPEAELNRLYAKTVLRRNA